MGAATLVSEVAPGDDLEGRSPFVAGGAPSVGPRLPLADMAVIASLLGLATFLWLPGIGAYLWFDKALSIGVAQQPLLDITSALRGDGSPPLWYGLLHVWGHAFGWSEASTHAFSAVVALAVVPVAWLGGSAIGGRRVAAFAAAAASHRPFLGHFSRETDVGFRGPAVGNRRSESCAGVRRRRPARSSSVRLEPFRAPVHPQLGPLHADRRRGCCPACARSAVIAATRLRQAAPALGVVVLLYLPWLPTLLAQVATTGAPWSDTPGARSAYARSQRS